MHLQSKLFRRWSVIGAGLGLGLGVLTSVFADAGPVKFTPGDGAVLTAPPGEVSLDTLEEMSSTAGANDLIVDNAQGQKVTTSAASVDAARLHMAVPLPAGLPSVRTPSVGTPLEQMTAIRRKGSGRLRSTLRASQQRVHSRRSRMAIEHCGMRAGP